MDLFGTVFLMFVFFCEFGVFLGGVLDMFFPVWGFVCRLVWIFWRFSMVFKPRKVYVGFPK